MEDKVDLDFIWAQKKKCLPLSHTSHTFQHSFYIKNLIAEAAST